MDEAALWWCLECRSALRVDTTGLAAADTTAWLCTHCGIDVPVRPTDAIVSLDLTLDSPEWLCVRCRTGSAIDSPSAFQFICSACGDEFTGRAGLTDSKTDEASSTLCRACEHNRSPRRGCVTGGLLAREGAEKSLTHMTGELDLEFDRLLRMATRPLRSHAPLSSSPIRPSAGSPQSPDHAELLCVECGGVECVTGVLWDASDDWVCSACL